MTRYLSNCCDAPEWLNEPQEAGGCVIGICSKCMEHAEFYDEEKAEDEWRQERDREIKEGR